jgi:hypothetical protein
MKDKSQDHINELKLLPKLEKAHEVTLHVFGQVDGSSMVMAYIPCIVSKVLKACNDNGDVQLVQLPEKIN